MNNLNPPENEALFNINRCFVCNTSVLDTTIKQCGACKRISYCSKAHQKEDWNNHKNFCKIIQKVEKEIQHEHLHVDNKVIWLNYRMSLTLRCGELLQRQLKMYEWQMISYPKRCEVCRSTNANIICKNCLCVNYCSEEHKNIDSKFHAENCNGLKKADSNVLGRVFDGSWNWSLRKGIIRLPDNIQDFITSNIIMCQTDPAQRENVELKISADISFPLTLAYGLNLLNFKVEHKLVAHIVGSKGAETAALNKWEIILHIYPQIKHLLIYFIGPEVVGPFINNMCTSCKKIFEFKCIKDLYHNFVKSPEYKKPDIVCTFHPGFHYDRNITASRSWLETLPLLFQDTPLIMTSLSRLEAQLDLEILNHVDSNLVVKEMENPFAGLVPLRSLVDTKVDYFNNIISVIFKNPAKN